MRAWTVAALGLLICTTCDPADVQPAASGQAVMPNTAQDEGKRLLQQKTAELHKLQDEVLKLGGTIANPRKVRITVRVVEVRVGDLKEHNLTDPFQPDADIWNTKWQVIHFESDKALLRALDLMVASGCADVLLSPSIVTSMGETVVVNCFREFPLTDDSEIVNKQRNLHTRSERVPGHAVLVRAVDNPDADLQVTFGYRLTTEEPAPFSSRMMTSTVSVKSGGPLIFGGLSTSPMSPNAVRQQLTAVPSALKPVNLAQTRLYTIVTAERLIDE